MAKSSRSGKPKVTDRVQVASKGERVACWREGLAQVKEEGRLLWLLGEGLGIVLTSSEVESVARRPEEVAAAVSAWARQALAAQPAFRLVPSAQGPAPVLSAATKGPAAAGTASIDVMLDGKPLTVPCPVLWLGTREWRHAGLTTVVVGVGLDGRKRVLSVRPGSVRDEHLAREVLVDLARRGLDAGAGVLVVTEGSRTLDAALHQTWGAQVLVSHCRRQLLDDLCSHLVEEERAAVCAQVLEACALPPAEAADSLRRLAKKLQRGAPGASERLLRSVDAVVVVNRLGVAPPLQERLTSLGTLNQALEKSHVGRHGRLVDLIGGLTRWLLQTRRIMGWQQLGSLAHAIQQLVATPAAPENENCTPSTSAVKGKTK
jgi:hypothetical protein